MEILTLGGTANSPETLKTLVGRTILGVVQRSDGAVVLIFNDGGFVVASIGGGNPAFWTIGKVDADRIVRERRDLIARYQNEIAALTALGPST